MNKKQLIIWNYLEELLKIIMKLIIKNKVIKRKMNILSFIWTVQVFNKAQLIKVNRIIDHKVYLNSISRNLKNFKRSKVWLIL
jgi:hypothetical protein